MRTTVVIDDKLMDEARQILGTTGIKDTIEAGLKEAIRRRRQDRLRASLGTFTFDVTNDEIERLEMEHRSHER